MKVSVFFITYNHEQYVAQSIEQIVNQRVNFEFELVIGEDKSTDNTRAICEQYAARYPNIIKLLPSDRNYGPLGNTIRTLHACTGTYIAMCEGDDYWQDPDKLQKQADFLDAHPDYSMCFTDTAVLDEMGWNLPDEKYFPRVGKDTVTIEDIILSDVSMIPTATLFFRNLLPDKFPEFYYHTFSGDLFLQLFMADKGKARHFNYKSAVYRNHGGGLTKSADQIERTYNNIFRFYLDVNKYFNFKYNTIIKKRLFEMTKTRLIYGSREKKGLEKFRYYTRTIPNYFRYADKINFRELAYYHMILFFPSLLRKMKKPV